MNMKIAQIGGGRMGMFFARQAPSDAKRLIIDLDGAKAKALADSVGAQSAVSLDAAADADVVAIVLPGGVVDAVAKQLGSIVKAGTIIMNMATGGIIKPETRAAFPKVTYVDAKVIGHAMSMLAGVPGCLVVNTTDEALFETVKACTPGYAPHYMGDTTIIPEIARIASTEAIRAAVSTKHELMKLGIQKEWAETAIYTMTAGCIRSYLDDDLGEFVRLLADKVEAEFAAKVKSGE